MKKEQREEKKRETEDFPRVLNRGQTGTGAANSEITGTFTCFKDLIHGNLQTNLDLYTHKKV